MKNKLSYFILVSISILLITTCSDNSTDPNAVGNIVGTVQQVNTQVPISGVLVSAGNISTTTAGDGKYELNGVSAGNVTLTATKSDYEIFQQTIQVQSNSTVTFNIKMTNSTAGTVIMGKVIEEGTTKPVAGVEITIAGQQDYTDSQGNYQITNVPQGTHQVIATKIGYLDFEGQVFLSSNNKIFDINIIKGTIIGGNINKDSTLTLDRTPYFVKSNIFVQGASILTVDPGVTLKFAQGTRLEVSYNGGTISAKSTSTSPITFTSEESNPLPGSWDGIVIWAQENNTLNRLDFENVIIEYATTGIATSNFRANAFSSIIKNFIIRYCEIGIGNGKYGISNGILENNKYGVYYSLWGSGLSNVTVRNNSKIGVYYSANITCSINNCTIENNGEGGVNIVDGKNNSTSGPDHNLVTNSIIKNNIGIGVKFIGDIGRFENNNFIGNSGYAFTRSARYYQTAPYYDVDGNYIANNNNISGVDTTINASGGQYTSTYGSQGYSIINPRSTPNLNIGSSWTGF